MAVSLDVVTRIKSEPNYLWDTTWDGFVGDWDPDDNRAGEDFTYDFGEEFGSSSFNPTGGFRARSPLHTAILLCLMSDRRAGPEDFIHDGSGDPRGWAGDAIDPSLAPLGSRLWLLRRSPLTEDTAALAVVYAQEALQTLIDQGVVAEFKISAIPFYDEGRLELYVEAYGRNEQRMADMNFWILWTSSLPVQEPLRP